MVHTYFTNIWSPINTYIHIPEKMGRNLVHAKQSTYLLKLSGGYVVILYIPKKTS